jgi:hypothetical protein
LLQHIQFSPVLNALIEGLTVDSRRRNRHGGDFARCQIQGEVVSIPLVHHFHTQVGTVQHIRPGAYHTTLRVEDGLVEVEPVQVEGHGRDAQGGKPDANHGPCTQEEVQGARVIEASVLEDQPTEVAVRCNDVVGFFFLTELVAVVLAFHFRRLTNQGGGHQRTVHGGEQAATEDTGHAQHVEGVHQDVVLGLEHEHEVEGAGDAQGHTIGERTLANRIDQEHGYSRGQRRTVSHADPRTHAQTVGQFPLTAHVASATQHEVQDHELVRTTVVEPFIQGCGFPDGVEVHADGVGGGHNCTRDDVVAIHQGACHGLADAVDVHGRSSDEGDDKADGGAQQGGNHQNPKPTDIDPVVGAGDPLTKTLPSISAFAALERSCHDGISALEKV